MKTWYSFTQNHPYELEIVNDEVINLLVNANFLPNIEPFLSVLNILILIVFYRFYVSSIRRLSVFKHSSSLIMQSLSWTINLLSENRKLKSEQNKYLNEQRSPSSIVYSWSGPTSKRSTKVHHLYLPNSDLASLYEQSFRIFL